MVIFIHLYWQGRNHGFKVGGGPSAQGASRVEAPKAPRGVGRGEKVSPSPLGDGTEEGAVRKFFDHLSENGEFWCILGGASALYVATAQETEAEEEGRERALVRFCC